MEGESNHENDQDDKESYQILDEVMDNDGPWTKQIVEAEELKQLDTGE